MQFFDRNRIFQILGCFQRKGMCRNKATLIVRL